MRFANVYGEEIARIFVVVVNLDHVTGRGAERRSSVAAEDHYERARAGAFTQMKVARSVRAKRAYVRRIFADAQFSPVHVRNAYRTIP